MTISDSMSRLSIRPIALSFLMTVVQLFDRIIARAEGCWIHKAMNAQTRNNVVRSWEKKLSDFVRTLHSIRVQAITQARKSGFGQRAAAIEANAGDAH